MRLTLSVLATLPDCAGCSVCEVRLEGRPSGACASRKCVGIVTLSAKRRVVRWLMAPGV